METTGLPFLVPSGRSKFLLWSPKPIHGLAARYLRHKLFGRTSGKFSPPPEAAPSLCEVPADLVAVEPRRGEREKLARAIERRSFLLQPSGQCWGDWGRQQPEH